MPTLKDTVFWYKDEATYLRFREIFNDPAQIAMSYADWLVSANKKFDALAQQGVNLIKIYADPDEFTAWCKVNSRPP